MKAKKSARIFHKVEAIVVAGYFFWRLVFGKEVSRCREFFVDQMGYERRRSCVEDEALVEISSLVVYCVAEGIHPTLLSKSRFSK